MKGICLQAGCWEERAKLFPWMCVLFSTKMLSVSPRFSEGSVLKVMRPGSAGATRTEAVFLLQIYCLQQIK